MSHDTFVFWRRRVLALAALLALVMVTVAAVRSGDGGSGGGGERASATQAPKPPPPPQLPRGGRTIFPHYRVVAFYGAPQDDELGVLGIGTLSQATRKLERQARPYARKTRPVLPALELLADIATAAPGDSGLYRSRQTSATIRRHLRAARKAKAMLILDIQPGRANFLDETKHLRRWLREPDVGLALDPEWHMGPGELPGQTIGSVTAQEVNAVSAYLAGIVRKHDLPQKLLLIHEFTDDMISDKSALKERRGLAFVINVDGFGDQPNKRSKYRAFTSEQSRFRYGFKVFYKEDTNMMTPSEVLRLRPRPNVVVYE